MNPINVTHINVLDNPGMFLNPLQFEITFECTQQLEDDLDWKVVYVGSAESEKYDQELESVFVGPVTKGVCKFVFQAPPPNPSRIPEQDLIGVTVVLVTCSYKQKEFIRVGYYVNNNYADPDLQQNPPSPPQVNLIHREILAKKPRVTRFPIPWDQPQGVSEAGTPGGAGPSASGAAMVAPEHGAASKVDASSAGRADMEDTIMDDMAEDEEMEDLEEESDDDDNHEIDLEAEDMDVSS